MKTVKILFALFSFILILGCADSNTGSGKNKDDNTQASDSTKVLKAMSGFGGFDCSNPGGNSGYIALEGNEATIRYKKAEDIIIVDILDTLYVEPPENLVNTSGILNELRDATKVLEIAFCGNNIYFKVYPKPVGQSGSQVCGLNESESNITCTKTGISVDTDPISAPDCAYSFSDGNDKNYFLFTQMNGALRVLYFSFSLGS